jgi:hypothetical protein
MNKEELIKLLQEQFVTEVERNEETWDELYENSDDQAIVFDKGWEAGFAYALHLIGELG